MAEVFKRDNKATKLAKLCRLIERDCAKAMLAEVNVWQKMMDTQWADFEILHDAVINRAGATELAEQQKVYDDTSDLVYKASMQIEARRIEVTPVQAAQLDPNTAPQPAVVDMQTQLRRRYGALTKMLAVECQRVIDTANDMPVEELDIQRTELTHLHTELHRVAMDYTANGADPAVIVREQAVAKEHYVVALRWLAAAQPPPPQQVQHIEPVVRDADALKVPQLNITPFDGAFDRWEAFRESFLHGIHMREHMPAVQKLQYMKTVLRGEPEELILNFSLTAANYEAAWTLLNQRYNNRRELITAHLRVLTSFTVCSASAEELRSMTNKTTSALMALRNLGRPTAEWHDWIVFHVCEKLDGETRRMWEQAHAGADELPTWEELDQFLQGRIRALSCSGLTETPKPNSRQSRSNNIRTHQTTAQQYVCPCCDDNHLITFCETFRRLPVPERRRMAADKGLCFNCLKRGHQAERCMSPRRCQTCNAVHNTMLHNDTVAETNEQQVRSNRAAYAPDAERRQRPPVLLATALVNVRDSAGDLHQVRALLDQGGDASFVSEQLAQSLRLPRMRENGELHAVAGVRAGRVKQSMIIQVSDCRGNDFAVDVDAYVLPRVTGELAVMPDIDVHRWPHIANLELADPDFMNPHAVEMILGSEVYGKVLLPGLRKATGLPTSQQTQFGWVMSGAIEQQQPDQRAIQIRTHHATIDAQLARFWEIEEVHMSRHLTTEEERCESIFERTVRSDGSGRLHVRLPMKHDDVVFGESQRFAVQRQLQIERRFVTNPQFADSYRAFMRQYEQLGHMREVIGAPVDLTRSRAMLPTSRREYYIPHHAVIKEASSTTKLRVVFDASRRTTNGTALNEQMLIGPRLQDDLTVIMMRWRQYRVAFCSDIEKMYRQIIVDEPDTDLQRIVWRPRADEAMKAYQLCTVTYGTASAPYLAIKSLHTLATRERERYPIGAHIVLTNFYVDDVLGGADTVAECIEAQAQLRAVMSSGGMTLRKWASNSEQVLAMVDPDDRETTLPLSIDDSASVSTLGVHWHPSNDELAFKVNISSDAQTCTKRTFLSEAARLFDPLGWLAPCTIAVKIMFQSLWKQHIDWDDALPRDMAEKWNEIRSTLHQVKELRIQRWIGTTAACELELHGFCDASMDAYAAVVYVRVSEANQQPRIFNLCAKTKVAPVKVISLPRLELCGAALLVKLIGHVQAAMQWPTVDVRCWTDSTIVLAWLRGHPSTFNIFVANRTAEIQRHFPIEHWRHVASGDNPADCASRGITPQQLLHHRLWWTGPQWLRGAREEWPPQVLATTTTEEARTRANNATTAAPCWELITNYSSWTRLVRVTAWCARFVHCCRSRKEERTFGPLRTAELMNMRDFWVRATQAGSYQDELRCLREQKPISKTSSLRSLNPVLSTDHVMRVGGRLTNASGLSQSSRTPAIVPRRSALSALLVSEAHHQTLHGGPALMLAYLRRAFWIVDGPNEVRRFVHSCTTCFRYTATPDQQMMAALPSARVVPSRTFLHCAIDFTGAIQVRSSKGRGHHATKAYVAVFVCMATKAVHIELVGDLTSVGFIAAFERFTARRGCCSDIYSDNATNFVGAAKFLRTERERFDSTLQAALASKGTTWHFSPPLSPHFNGLAESAIRCVKHHIRRVIGETTLTYEELTTVLAKIEACLNSRPLCPMTSDPDNYDVLTPGHFIVGEPLITIPQRSVIDSKMSALTRWQLTHQLVQRFWKRWSVEYLHTLQQRRKWQSVRDNVRVGDLVLLLEDNLPPAKWAMARVIEVHPGDDGRVRVVTVRARGSTFTRSVVRVARLPSGRDNSGDTE